MAKESIDAWITKHALTKGIEKIRAELHDNPKLLIDLVNQYECYYGEGREWHRTPEAALARAEQMREEKLASLRRQIDRVERIRFEAKR